MRRLPGDREAAAWAFVASALAELRADVAQQFGPGPTENEEEVSDVVDQ